MILAGHAAGIVSPLTAACIHSSWQHGWAVGKAVAQHERDAGPSPELAAERAAPRYRIKRALRWAFDHCQMDWPFDLMLGAAPMRWAAERVYFHRRAKSSWR